MLKVRPTPFVLPISEYLHPVSLFALAVLILNDHLLKGASILPTWMTGKLSDVAGMIFFPLLLTSVWNCGKLFFYWRKSNGSNSTPPKTTLTHFQLLSAIAISGSILVALQFCPHFVSLYVQCTATIGLKSTVTPDPMDLIALPALFVPYRIGIQEIQRIQSKAHI